MNNMTKIPIMRTATYLILLLSIYSFSIGADSFWGGGQFLRYGVGARSLALGGAYSSYGHDASSIFYNPAGLIRGDRHFEAHSMFVNLNNAARYNYYAATVNRINLSSKRFLNPLFGENCAWGFGFLDLSSGEFEKRDIFDNKYGEFELYQRAMYISFAREWIFKSSFIMQFGFTHKTVFQKIDEYKQDASAGLDIGIQFQPLRNIVPIFGSFKNGGLPFRFSLLIRNAIQPKLKGDIVREKLPLSWRPGVSYERWVWGRHNLLVLAEYETTNGDNVESNSWHTGLEFKYNSSSKLSLAGRIGYSYIDPGYKKITCGFGLEWEVKNHDVAFDYALYPSEDLEYGMRFSLSIKFGSSRSTKYHHDKAIKYSTTMTTTDDSTRARNECLQVISRYHQDSTGIREIVNLIANTLDTVNSKRYHSLIGGLGLARNLYDDIENKWFNYADKINNKALISIDSTITINYLTIPEHMISDINVAIKEYSRAFESKGDFKEFKPRDFLDYLKLIILNKKAELYQPVVDKCVNFNERDQQEFDFLKGIYQYKNGSKQTALSNFKNAINKSNLNPDIDQITNYYAGLIYAESGEYENAISNFESVLEQGGNNLSDNYPRFSIFSDFNLTDDAMIYKGLCKYEIYKISNSSDDLDEALNILSNINRYYPGLDHAVSAESMIKEIIQR